MCYKAELQKKNEEKLNEQFTQENVPMFIQEAVIMRISGRNTRLMVWHTVKEMLNWMISKGYIKKTSVGEIDESDLDHIMPMQMMWYFDYLLKEKGIARTTFVTNKNQLSSFFGKLKERHYVRDNIVTLVDSSEYKATKTNRKKTAKQPLPEDIEEMMERLKSRKNEFLRIRNLTIFRVLRGTGLRVSELVGLDMKDVYLDAKYLDARHPRPYILVISKGTYDYTDDGKDIVFLTKDAIEAFKEWFEFRSHLDNIQDENAVFVNRDGSRTSDKTIKDMFKTHSDGKITPHMMRHEYTMQLQRESNDRTFVQEQGRWKSSMMMDTVYDSGTVRSIGALDNM